MHRGERGRNSVAPDGAGQGQCGTKPPVVHHPDRVIGVDLRPFDRRSVRAAWIVVGGRGLGTLREWRSAEPAGPERPADVSAAWTALSTTSPTSSGPCSKRSGVAVRIAG